MLAIAIINDCQLMLAGSARSDSGCDLPLPQMLSEIKWLSKLELRLNFFLGFKCV